MAWLLVLLFQELSPDATFRKIEESIHTSTSLSIKVSGEGAHTVKDGGVSAPYTFTTTFLAVKGKGIYRSTSIVEKGITYENSLIWDSVRPRLGGSGKPIEAPKWLESELWGAIAPCGIELPAKLELGVSEGRQASSNFSFGPAEGDLKCLKYHLTCSIGLAGEATLLYDPKTWTPKKRTLTLGNAASSELINETYEVFSRNVEVPQERFKIE